MFQDVRPSPQEHSATRYPLPASTISVLYESLCAGGGTEYERSCAESSFKIPIF